MSGVEGLLRADLRDFGGYASAAGRGFAPRIRLDANESPWSSPVDDTGALRCYPEPQPPTLVARLARLHGVAETQVLACRGSDEGIDLLLRASCVPGAGAVVVAPPDLPKVGVRAAVASRLELLAKGFCTFVARSLVSTECYAEVQVRIQ